MHALTRLYEQFKPSSYSLALDLVNAPERTYTGSVAITGECLTAGTIRLHAKDLTILVARVGDTNVTTTIGDNDEISLTSPSITLGVIDITIDFSGQITDSMHGLYPCYFDVDGVKKELLATQFESHHAREVFPCIDEPEAKATFDLQLTTVPDVQALSNMPEVAKHATAATSVTWVFDTSPRMSTYLLAFVVGELHKKSASTTSGVEVNVWATHAQPARLLDFPLDVAVRSIDFFNEYFGVPYPLPKADHVALPDFSSGAMENWGLITYREVALLADESTAQSAKEWVATVIAHETSHQWFGNLVTMKWWDDLWLNESFATVMEYIAVDALFPSWNAWNNFASQETLSALRRDQLSGVQPVRVTVNHPDEIASLFDPAIVYAKGARLLKMLHTYIGDEAFRAGLKLYFETHAYSNTDGDDLWAAFEKTSGKAVGSFMNAWLGQSGLPLVKVLTTGDGYALDQQRFVLGEPADDRVWPIPLGSLNHSMPAVMSQKHLTITSDHSAPLLNVGNTGHFVTQYDDAAFAVVLDNIAKYSTIDRLALLHETSLLARSGEAKTADMIPLLMRYADEREEPVWGIISLVIGDLKRFVDDDTEAEQKLKQLVRRLALPLYERLGTEPVANESEQDAKLRATALGLLAYAEYSPVITWGQAVFADADDFATIDSELRPVVFVIASRHGSDSDFRRLLSTLETTQDAELRDDIMAGVTSTKRSVHIEELLARITDSRLTKPQDVTRWFINLLRNRFARDAAWQWMIGNWEWIEETFAGDKSYDDYPRYSANVLGTHEWLARYIEFFGPKSGQPALARAIEVGQIEITTRVQWLQRDTPGVIAALAQQKS